MGCVRFGIPEYIAIQAQQYGVRHFVETGTLWGGTARWAARYFPSVITIEADPYLHESAVRELSPLGIVALGGDSAVCLSDALKTIPPGTKVLFWLDAHWDGRGPKPASKECPLMDEIAAIEASGVQAFYLIDDARGFTTVPLPEPFDPKCWPTWDTLLPILSRGRTVDIVDDVIVAWPTEFPAKFNK